MTTKKHPGSSPNERGNAGDVGFVVGGSAVVGSAVVGSGVVVGAGRVGYAGADAFAGGRPQPSSFWTALCRYRERHGLTDPQQKPTLDDADLKDLRANDNPRDVSFDDLDIDADRLPQVAKRS